MHLCYISFFCNKNTQVYIQPFGVLENFLVKTFCKKTVVTLLFIILLSLCFAVKILFVLGIGSIKFCCLLFFFSFGRET